MSDEVLAVLTLVAVVVVGGGVLRLASWGRDRCAALQQAEPTPLQSVVYFVLELALIVGGLALYVTYLR